MGDFEKGQVLELNIDFLNHFGIGISKRNETTFEVPKTYPGEKVAVVLEEKFYPKIWRARVQKVLIPSPDRIASECPNSEYCQGCASDYLNYEKQLEIKNEKIRSLFPEAKNIIPSPKLWQYRSSATFIFKKEKHKILISSPAKGSLDTFSLENCQIIPEIFNPILETICKTANQYDFSIYNPVIQKGYFIGFDLKYSFAENKILLVFLTQTGEMKNQKELLNALTGKHPELVSIYHNKKSGKRLESELIFGERFLVEKLEKSGLKFKLTPQTLFYSNLFQAEKLYEYTTEKLNLTGREKILDLFSGIGVSSIYLAKRTKLTYGIERHPLALKEAISNARLNQSENVIFIEQGIETLKASDDVFKEEPDALFLKPPQELPEDFFQILKEKEIQKIVYVSSYPEALQKDIEKLKALDYFIQAVQPFDFYPHSFHVETAVFLQKRRKIVIKKKA